MIKFSIIQILLAQTQLTELIDCTVIDVESLKDLDMLIMKIKNRILVGYD